MELRQLQYFLAVADCGSLLKASTILGIAQPALSRQMRHLEEELGVALFYRHGRGSRLTEEGEQFQATIAPLIRDILQARSDLRSNAGVPGGEIAFGMPPSISAVVGAQLVQHFLQRFPQVKLHIVDGFSGYINEWLAAGRLDMAVINNARRSPSIRMDKLLTVDLFFITRRGKPGDEDASPTIGFDDVLSRRLILPGRHHGLRRELDAAAQRKGAALDVIVEIDSLTALKSLVRSGAGPSVLPYGAIGSDAADPAFLVRRIVEPHLTMQFMIAYSLQRPTTMAMREITRVLRTELRAAIEDGRMTGLV